MCKLPVIYPTPFELHFSVTHLKRYQENPAEYLAKMKGTDRVLAEHPGAFEAAPLERIAKEINRIILWHDSRRQC